LKIELVLSGMHQVLRYFVPRSRGSLDDALSQIDL